MTLYHCNSSWLRYKPSSLACMELSPHTLVRLLICPGTAIIYDLCLLNYNFAPGMSCSDQAHWGLYHIKWQRVQTNCCVWDCFKLPVECCFNLISCKNQTSDIGNYKLAIWFQSEKTKSQILVGSLKKALGGLQNVLKGPIKDWLSCIWDKCQFWGQNEWRERNQIEFELKPLSCFFTHFSSSSCPSSFLTIMQVLTAETSSVQSNWEAIEAYQREEPVLAQWEAWLVPQMANPEP